MAGRTLGMWAVIGFFCLSGYLIMGSRQRYGLGEFLVHRVARIYPAYIVSTVMVVAVFAPLTYAIEQGGLAGYLTHSPTTPLTYLWGNAFLRMNAYDVAGTLSDVPYPSVWNGALWSLQYEFLCYLLLAVLGLWAAIVRSRLAVAALFVVFVVLYANIHEVSSYVTQEDFPLFLSLVPCFLGGSLLYLFRNRLRLSTAGAAASAGAAVLVIWLVPAWGPQLSAPAILYVLLWVGAVLPSPQVVRTHDVSYGMYIFGFPVQQLLVFAGAKELGVTGFVAISVVATLPFAIVSWLAVERPVMLRTRRTPRLIAEGQHLPVDLRRAG